MGGNDTEAFSAELLDQLPACRDPRTALPPAAALLLRIPRDRHGPALSRRHSTNIRRMPQWQLNVPPNEYADLPPRGGPQHGKRASPECGIAQDNRRAGNRFCAGAAGSTCSAAR